MWQKNVRYLDYNASSGISLFVRQQIAELITQSDILANPSSRHRPGQRVKSLLYQASSKTARSLGVSTSPEELVFTASGTESNQTVIKTLCLQADEIFIGSGDHSASYDLIPEIKGIPVASIPMLPSGAYDFGFIENTLQTAPERKVQTIALSLFWANNETGVITDLIALQKIIESAPVRVLLHLDGAQVWGKLPIDVEKTPADFITFSSHKIGAPAGTGLIWMRKGSRLNPLISGTQSRGLRGGTENTLGILATSLAAESLNPVNFQAHTAPLQKALEEGLLKLPTSIKIWGASEARVSNTTRFSFTDYRSYENWVELLDLRGFAVSHGSACKAQVIEPSRVLLKMGATREEALNSIRVSFGEENTRDDVNGFLEALQSIIERKLNGKVDLPLEQNL